MLLLALLQELPDQLLDPGDVSSNLKDQLLILGVLEAELVGLRRPDMLLADDASQKTLLSFQDVWEAGKEEQLSLTNIRNGNIEQNLPH